MSTHMIRLDVGFDKNGRPRRVYILIRDNVVVNAWDEGFDSVEAVPSEYRKMAALAPIFDTSPREYCEILRGKKVSQ